VDSRDIYELITVEDEAQREIKADFCIFLKKKRPQEGKRHKSEKEQLIKGHVILPHTQKNFFSLKKSLKQISS
jgi:hypothetical protein